MAYLKFDLARLERLNDPGRLDDLRPDVMWSAVGSPEEAQVIVEIGAGTGLFSAEFAALAPQAVVYAADLAPEMVDWMRANRPEAATGRLVALQSEETHVPLEDGIADLVIMINLHHELADPVSTYAEAFRLLAPRGRLLVADWAPGDSPKGPPQAIRISGAAAADFVSAAGLTDARVHEGLPYAWLVTAMRP